MMRSVAVAWLRRAPNLFSSQVAHLIQRYTLPALFFGSEKGEFLEESLDHCLGPTVHGVRYTFCPIAPYGYQLY